jgi:anthranilate synthase component 1
MKPYLRHFELELDLHALHVAHPQRYPFLLETVALGSTGNQFDILFAFPAETLLLDHEYELHMVNDNGDHSGVVPGTHNDFLDGFNHWWDQQLEEASKKAPDIPFSGGWFVYLSYELAQQIEPRLELPLNNDGLPVAFATRIPAAIIRDHQNGRLIVVAEAGRKAQFQTLCSDLEFFIPPAEPEAIHKIAVREISEDPPQDYTQSVERIRQYIREGDVFQVNLSRLWQATLETDITHNDLYLTLRQNNPAPFFGLVTLGDNAIISSSPERLVRVQDNIVETRPIAGTRPRSDSSIADEANQTELLAHPKERAEHIMLIDLERNDLGRVCVPGSVHVDELMVLESYAHVHHIVSNVRGELRADTKPGDVIRAVFPGGTITGCPKVRCMEIIAELEQTGRGAYTGSMGYINLDGSMDLNILIRTMVKKGQQLFIRAGAGIVSDSIPEKELEETRAKARGLLLALGIEPAS